MERELILTRLLEKYENSMHVREPNASSRRVMLRIQRNELPEYVYETAEIRDRFNEAARSLERERLVKVERLKDRPVVTAIILNLEPEQLRKAYIEAGRTHPMLAAEDFCAFIENELSEVKTPWIKAWRDDTCQKIRKTLRLPAICKQGHEFAREFVGLLGYYDSLNGAAMTARALSIACFQNSKRFEQDFQPVFIREARRFDPDIAEISGQDEYGAREILALMGVYSQPELYQLSGHCRVIMRSGEFSLSPLFPYGIAIQGPVADDIESFDLQGIRKITFIENLTNYYEYLRTEIARDELAVYHGGFISPGKRQFFEKISESMTIDIETHFWADIDLGGFRMFRLLQKVFPGLRPMRMSAEEVAAYAQKGLARDAKYLARLQTALDSGEFPMFDEAIREILRCEVTIEQEVFLLDV